MEPFIHHCVASSLRCSSIHCSGMAMATNLSLSESYPIQLALFALHYCYHALLFTIWYPIKTFLDAPLQTSRCTLNTLLDLQVCRSLLPIHSECLNLAHLYNPHPLWRNFRSKKPDTYVSLILRHRGLERVF